MTEHDQILVYLSHATAIQESIYDALERGISPDSGRIIAMHTRMKSLEDRAKDLTGDHGHDYSGP